MKRKHQKPVEIIRSSKDVIQREAGDNAKEGTFTAVLATNGEASDGHILHIKGLTTPKKMPLLFGHRSEVQVPSLGSVTKPVKGKTKDGEHDALRVTNVINMEGDGQLSEIRRNIAGLVHNGDLNAMSIRWVPEEVIRRIELPAGHYAHVPPNASRDTEAYWGYFHKKARSEEGSIVAIGADPQALNGRAQELKDGAASVFFRSLASSVEQSPDGMALLSLAFERYQSVLKDMRNAGVSSDDMALLVGSDAEEQEIVPYNYLAGDGSLKRVLLPRAAWEALQGESSAAFKAALELQGEAKAGPIESDSEDDLTPEERRAADSALNSYRRKPVVDNTKYYPIKKKRSVQLSQKAINAMIGASVTTAVAKATGEILE